MPIKARVARKVALFVNQNCEVATMDQSVICIGIQRSGPNFLEMSWEGSSASRKETRKTMLPWL